MPLGPHTLHHTPDLSAVWHRELTGADETGVNGIRSADAVALLDRVLQRAPTSEEPVRAAALAVPDRDRILASLYVHAYGPTVESVVTCGRCEERFDVEFALPDLMASLDRGVPPDDIETSERGAYRQKNGACFRLPTGEDEMAVAGLTIEDAERELLERCVLEGSAGEGNGSIAAAMEAVAPLLDLELTARCPECRHEQPVRFEIEHYVLSSLVRDRPGVFRDVHRLALAYGWSLAEILSLPRRERRRLVELVETDVPRRRKVSG